MKEYRVLKPWPALIPSDLQRYECMAIYEDSFTHGQLDWAIQNGFIEEVHPKEFTRQDMIEFAGDVLRNGDATFNSLENWLKEGSTE